MLILKYSVITFNERVSHSAKITGRNQLLFHSFITLALVQKYYRFTTLSVLFAGNCILGVINVQLYITDQPFAAE